MKKFLSRRSRGFTIIEVLVVISIIGILTSIVLASLTTARSHGRDAERKSELAKLSLALETYYDATGHYPVGTCISSPWWGCWGSAGEARLFFPESYVKVMPQDQLFYDNGNACGSKGSYLYSYFSDNGQRYALTTNLETAPATTDQNYYSNSYGCTYYANWAIVKGL